MAKRKNFIKRIIQELKETQIFLEEESFSSHTFSSEHLIRNLESRFWDFEPTLWLSSAMIPVLLKEQSGYRIPDIRKKRAENFLLRLSYLKDELGLSERLWERFYEYSLSKEQT